jgi:hypothetical protein
MAPRNTTRNRLASRSEHSRHGERAANRGVGCARDGIRHRVAGRAAPSLTTGLLSRRDSHRSPARVRHAVDWSGAPRRSARSPARRLTNGALAGQAGSGTRREPVSRSLAGGERATGGQLRSLSRSSEIDARRSAGLSSASGARGLVSRGSHGLAPSTTSSSGCRDARSSAARRRKALRDSPRPAAACRQA